MAFARPQRPRTTFDGADDADADADALVNGELLAAGPAAYAPDVRQRAHLLCPLKILEQVSRPYDTGCSEESSRLLR